jgi:hypothetical protein
MASRLEIDSLVLAVLRYGGEVNNLEAQTAGSHLSGPSAAELRAAPASPFNF